MWGGSFCPTFDERAHMNRMQRRLSRIITLLAAAILVAWTSNAFAEDGAALFTAKCAACHGKDATGKTPMGEKLKARDLHSPEVQKQTDAELKAIIAKGKEKMPAYGTKLSKEQIEALVAYVRTLVKK